MYKSDQLDITVQRDALRALAARRGGRTKLIIDGADALILTGELQLGTSDCDVLYATPDLGQLQDDIRAVANGLGIGSGWLDGGVQIYLESLPTDFRVRLRTLPHLGAYLTHNVIRYTLAE